MIANNWCVVCHVKLLISRGRNENISSDNDADQQFMSRSETEYVAQLIETRFFALENVDDKQERDAELPIIGD